jgi:Brp/Blh family beta-carotene 15,15'-monooxygenase
LKLAPPTAAEFDGSQRSVEQVVKAGRFIFADSRAWPWCVLAFGVLSALIDPAFTTTAAPWPFVIALFVFGMPHGCADWIVAARLSGRVGAWSRISGFTGYLCQMLACLALMALLPGVAALMFLCLTMFHFGMADATAVGADKDGFVARWGLALGRGMLLLSTAFAAHPVAAWAPFEQIETALSAWQHGAASAWMPTPQEMRPLAMIGVGAGVVFALASAAARARRGHARAAVLDLVEHALVASMAALADPLFAVGMFFIGVHAFRHTRRLACTKTIIAPSYTTTHIITPPYTTNNFLARLVRVHVISLPLLWPTIPCMIPLCWLLGGFNAHSLAVASIAFYMITTLPHHLLGLRLPAADLSPAAA